MNADISLKRTKAFSDALQILHLKGRCYVNMNGMVVTYNGNLEM